MHTSSHFQAGFWERPQSDWYKTTTWADVIGFAFPHDKQVESAVHATPHFISLHLPKTGLSYNHSGWSLTGYHLQDFGSWKVTFCRSHKSIIIYSILTCHYTYNPTIHEQSNNHSSFPWVVTQVSESELNCTTIFYVELACLRPSIALTILAVPSIQD